MYFVFRKYKQILNVLLYKYKIHPTFTLDSVICNSVQNTAANCTYFQVQFQTPAPILGEGLRRLSPDPAPSALRRYVDTKQRYGLHLNDDDLPSLQMFDGLCQPPPFHISVNRQMRVVGRSPVLYWNSRLRFKTLGGTQRGCTLLYWVSGGLRYPMFTWNESSFNTFALTSLDGTW